LTALDISERGLLEIKLNRLADVIAGCWTEAESSLTRRVAQKHPNPGEGLIAKLLMGDLRGSIGRASRSRGIDHAFLEDLGSQIAHLNYSDSQRFAGLAASVTPHNQSHEGNIRQSPRVNPSSEATL
jgi:hypothetical protein